jgi:hypothetical protein
MNKCHFNNKSTKAENWWKVNLVTDGEKEFLYNNNNGSSYIAHFTNVPMRFTSGGGLFRAVYYGAIGSQAAYNHER